MKTNVYIDGFNFYFACYKNWEDPICHEFRAFGPYKWLNFRALCEASFPNDDIHRIHYCTAKVRGTRSDPNKPVRQQTFLETLRTTPPLVIHLGHFEPREKRGLLVDPFRCVQNPPCLSGLVRVSVREEKGSDVNLATALLRDAFLGDFEKAVVISNDSDLESAIRTFRVDARLPVHVMSPYLNVVRDLRSAANSHSVLDKSLIPRCQFPDRVPGRKGVVLIKPRGW